MAQGAGMLVLLYRSHAVPRFVTVWGLVGAPPYLTSQLLILYHAPAPFTTLGAIVAAQFALNELALIIWLLTKGLHPTPGPATGPARVMTAAAPTQGHGPGGGGLRPAADPTPTRPGGGAPA